MKWLSNLWAKVYNNILHHSKNNISLSINKYLYIFILGTFYMSWTFWLLDIKNYNAKPLSTLTLSDCLQYHLALSVLEYLRLEAKNGKWPKIKNMLVGEFEPWSRIIYEGYSTTRVKTHFEKFMPDILHIINSRKTLEFVNHVNSESLSASSSF